MLFVCILSFNNSCLWQDTDCIAIPECVLTVFDVRSVLDGVARLFWKPYTVMKKKYFYPCYLYCARRNWLCISSISNFGILHCRNPGSGNGFDMRFLCFWCHLLSESIKHKEDCCNSCWPDSDEGEVVFKREDPGDMLLVLLGYTKPVVLEALEGSVELVHVYDFSAESRIVVSYCPETEKYKVYDIRCII